MGFTQSPLQKMHAHQVCCFKALPYHSTYQIISSQQHELLLVRRLFTAYEQVALSQNGSEGVDPFGVVLEIRFVISFTTSVSSLI